MCPKGDDPLTFNQNYRKIKWVVELYTYPVLGKVGLTFNRKTVFVDVHADSAKCTSQLSFQGAFGQVDCVYEYMTLEKFAFTITFYSWPTYPKDNNLYANEGNPAITEFFCDMSQISPYSGPQCTFSDIMSTNIRGNVTCISSFVLEFNNFI
jgi:hypothetical protein